jgi:hypothetical protein
MKVKIEIDEIIDENKKNFISDSSALNKIERMKKLNVTKTQRIELVEESLRLKDNKVEKPNLCAIKNFYQRHYFVEFETHEKFNSWKLCFITSSHVGKWTKKYIKEKSTEDSPLAEAKIRANVELKNFIEKPAIKINWTESEKEQIINKSISLETETKFPRLEAVKWFLKENYPSHFDECETFNIWTKCNLNSNLVTKWVKRLLKRQNEPPKPAKSNKRKFGESKINSGK